MVQKVSRMFLVIQTKICCVFLRLFVIGHVGHVLNIETLFVKELDMFSILRMKFDKIF